MDNIELILEIVPDSIKQLITQTNIHPLLLKIPCKDTYIYGGKIIQTASNGNVIVGGYNMAEVMPYQEILLYCKAIHRVEEEMNKDIQVITTMNADATYTLPVLFNKIDIDVLETNLWNNCKRLLIFEGYSNEGYGRNALVMTININDDYDDQDDKNFIILKDVLPECTSGQRSIKEIIDPKVLSNIHHYTKYLFPQYLVQIISAYHPKRLVKYNEKEIDFEDLVLKKNKQQK